MKDFKSIYISICPCAKQQQKTNKDTRNERKKYLPKPGIVQNSFEFSGLNQGPSDLQSDALPTELFRQLVKGVVQVYIYFLFDSLGTKRQRP